MMVSLKKNNNKEELRPPVVVILGHIDHGKSTLLDYIRKTNTTEREAGGITQHAGAYEIKYTSKDNRERRITFLDTPGHEAFASIRTRCTSAADMAALVVSAEDGVKPQTIEAIKYIKECSLPFIVAITKVDKPTADINRTKQSLAEQGIFVEGYGGNIPVVELSAVTGQGVEEFLDLIILLAELEGKKAERKICGSGIIIEVKHDPKRGIIAMGIIKEGTVRKGLFAATIGAVAPIRFLLDENGRMVNELSVSSPVQIIGWDAMPKIGSKFVTFPTKEEAIVYSRSGSSNNAGREIKSEAKGVELILPCIIKADTIGSLETITREIMKLARENIAPKIIFSGIGNITDNDIKIAQTSKNTVIIGFNVKVDARIAILAERLNIPIFIFNIIYELTDKINELLSEMAPKTEIEKIEGTAKILKIFSSAKSKQIIGGRVLSGIIRCNAPFRIIRRESKIGHGKIRELQQFKAAVESLGEGSDFGALIESRPEVAPGDKIEIISILTE